MNNVSLTLFENVFVGQIYKATNIELHVKLFSIFGKTGLLGMKMYDFREQSILHPRIIETPNKGLKTLMLTL